MDTKVAVKNLCEWDLYFNRAEGSGDVRVPSKGVTRLSRGEIQAQVYNGNKMFTGTDEQGSHAKLYVDDKTELTERIEIKENGEKVILETVGDKWSYLQRTKFGASAQPYYVILDSNGNPKTGYFQFTRNVKDFKKFLESGL